MTRRPMTRLAGLVTAAHPGPSVVVTAVVVGLGVSAGLDGATLALLALAVLLGQLSIGWSNDWIDGRAGRDAGRPDKPTASGAVALSRLRATAAASLVLCAVASLALGTAAAVAHLIAVAGGWVYNAWAKTTPASIVPYVLSFGL
ncbi:MAG TPA: UbiA family prenyltransferase, partial [Euzebya sp.]|nr:UbiA family prenyltransferase [Euzebya sp.]